MLAPHELKLLHPRRRLAVMVPPPPADLSYGNDDEYDSDEEDAPYGSDDDDEPGVDEWDDLEVDERDSKGPKGAVGGGEQAGERLGRGGLRIVTHDPVDDYGMPMTGLDAGIRKAQPAGRGGKAAPAAAVGGPSGSGKQGQGQQQRALAREAKAQARGQGRTVRGTYMWSDLVRVDVLSGPPTTALVFYGPPATRVVGLPYIPVSITVLNKGSAALGMERTLEAKRGTPEILGGGKKALPLCGRHRRPLCFPARCACLRCSP